MTISELPELLERPDSLRIIKDNKQIYIGYLGCIGTKYEIDWKYIGLTGKEKVKKFRIETDIKHKKWKELQLMPPYEPERIADYSFSDLQLTIYYTIYI